jgi:hypothetical protein
MIWPAFAFAQESQTVEETMASVAGLEVKIDGWIGTGLDMMEAEALGFRTREGVYFPVVFDAGREARRKLEGCRFQIFGGGTPCDMTGQAELEWDGSRLRLIIFEVANIEPPERLP